MLCTYEAALIGNAGAYFRASERGTKEKEGIIPYYLISYYVGYKRLAKQVLLRTGGTYFRASFGGTEEKGIPYYPSFGGAPHLPPKEIFRRGEEG